MPRTQIPGEQVTDGTIRRQDLNTDETGNAIVLKIIEGTGIVISSTGVDTGTGDVTVNADTTTDTIQRLFAFNRGSVPGTGEIFMNHDGNIPHSKVPIVLDVAFTLKEVSIAVDKVDSSNDYVVRFYINPTVSPSLQHSPLTLLSGNLDNSATGLSLAMAADNWGISLARTSGSGSSDFKHIVINFFIVKV